MIAGRLCVNEPGSPAKRRLARALRSITGGCARKLAPRRPACYARAMFRFAVKLALAAAAVWAVWSFVPIRGRTLAARWRAAGGLVPFVERSWSEATGTPARQARSPARERPTEGHSEADRRALDRILTQRLGERR